LQRIIFTGSAFPSITSLRYLDSEDERQHHILCRENTFIEPVDGWKKAGRTFLAVCGSIGTIYFLMNIRILQTWH